MRKKSCVSRSSFCRDCARLSPSRSSWPDASESRSCVDPRRSRAVASLRSVAAARTLRDPLTKCDTLLQYHFVLVGHRCRHCAPTFEYASPQKQTPQTRVRLGMVLGSPSSASATKLVFIEPRSPDLSSNAAVDTSPTQITPTKDTEGTEHKHNGASMYVTVFESACPSVTL